MKPGTFSSTASGGCMDLKILAVSLMTSVSGWTRQLDLPNLPGR